MEDFNSFSLLSPEIDYQFDAVNDSPNNFHFIDMNQNDGSPDYWRYSSISNGDDNNNNNLIEETVFVPLWRSNINNNNNNNIDDDYNIYSNDNDNDNNLKTEEIVCIPPIFESIPSNNYDQQQDAININIDNDDNNKTVATQEIITKNNLKTESMKSPQNGKSKKRKLNEMDDNNKNKERERKKRKLCFCANDYILVNITKKESNIRFIQYVNNGDVINNSDGHFCAINGCSKSFASSPHLKRHVLEIHIGRRYQCIFPKCLHFKNGINWKQKSQCKEHVINKHCKACKPWKCYLCSSKFTRYGGVKRHLELRRCEIMKNNLNKIQQNKIIENSKNNVYKNLSRV